MTPGLRQRGAREGRCLHLTAELYGTRVACRTLRPGDARPIRIGSTPGCDIGAAHMPLGALDLARAVEGGFEVCVQSHWAGHLEIAGERIALAVAAAQGRPAPGWGAVAFAMPRDARLVAEIDGLRLLLEETHAENHALRPRPRPGLRELLALGVAAAAHIGILGAADSVSRQGRPSAPEAETAPLVIEINEDAHRRLGRRLEWRETPPRRTESRAGRRGAPPAVPSAPSPDGDEPADAQRAAAVERARGAGILALGELIGADAIEQMAGDFEPITRELLDDYGRWLPSELDSIGGGWGHGIRRIGPGSGDGRDWTAVETGKHALADGEARGDAYVAAAYERLSRPRRAIIDVETSLDQFDRAGVPYDQVRGRLGMARYGLRRCFEAREIAVPRSLSISFTLDPAGEIASVAFDADDTNELDEPCLTRALRHVRFERGHDAGEARITDFPVRL